MNAALHSPNPHSPNHSPKKVPGNGNRGMWKISVLPMKRPFPESPFPEHKIGEWAHTSPGYARGVCACAYVREAKIREWEKAKNQPVDNF